jgi:hypothetical protein
MTKRLSLVFALVAAGLLGCSTAAEEKCKDFESAFCERVSACSKSSKDTCASELSKKADCSKAEEVPSDFDKCVPAVQALACSSLTDIPASCNIKLRD